MVLIMVLQMPNCIVVYIRLILTTGIMFYIITLQVASSGIVYTPTKVATERKLFVLTTILDLRDHVVM